MKKLILICSLMCGIAYTQPQVAISGFGSVAPTALTSATTNLTFFNIKVHNVSFTDTFNNQLVLKIGVDTNGTVNTMDSVDTGPNFIPPLDSITVPSVIFDVDPVMFKEGNNTVVIWPYGTDAVTFDSLEINFTFTGVDELLANNLPVKTGPNPAGDYLFLYDPDNLLKDVRIINSQGQYVPAPYAGNMLTLTNVPRGIYILELSTSRGIFSRKLIVER